MKDSERIVDEHLAQAAKENAEKIASCAVFMCLFNESMIEEVIPVLQMGLAVYLDKPIYLLVPSGATVPDNLRRLAQKIEYFDRSVDPASITEATVRLFEDLNKEG